MLTKVIEQANVDRFAKWLNKAENMVIVTHMSPDGDALGSSLGLMHFLESQDKNVRVIVPNGFPDFLRWMDGAQRILRYDKHPDEADKLILAGDSVEIINAVAKPSRFAGLELSVGNGSVIRVAADEEIPVQISGRIVLRSFGLTLENAEGVYVLLGENLPEPGMKVTISGMLSGVRLKVAEGWIQPADYAAVVSSLSSVE